MTGAERQIDRRLAERCPVREAARIRHVAARNQPRPVAAPVTIVDVSLMGAGLRVTDGFDLRAGWLVELGIEDDWSRARIIWARAVQPDVTVGGVEFVAAEPSFLEALVRWMDREDTLAR